MWNKYTIQRIQKNLFIFLDMNVIACWVLFFFWIDGFLVSTPWIQLCFCIKLCRGAEEVAGTVDVKQYFSSLSCLILGFCYNAVLCIFCCRYPVEICPSCYLRLLSMVVPMISSSFLVISYKVHDFITFLLSRLMGLRIFFFPPSSFFFFYFTRLLSFFGELELYCQSCVFGD